MVRATARATWSCTWGLGWVVVVCCLWVWCWAEGGRGTPGGEEGRRKGRGVLLLKLLLLLAAWAGLGEEGGVKGCEDE